VTDHGVMVPGYLPAEELKERIDSGEI